MIQLRSARKTDAADLARLVNFAGEGMPIALWQDMTPDGGNVWDTGAARAARESGSFSYRNAQLAMIDGAVAGAMIAYEAVMDDVDDATPPMFRPLIELENIAEGSFYLNVLATFPEFRGKGVG